MPQKNLLGDPASIEVQALFRNAKAFFEDPSVIAQNKIIFKMTINNLPFAVIQIPSSKPGGIPTLYAIKENTSLGQGAFGSVTIGQTEDGSCFAVKCQSRDDDEFMPRSVETALSQSGRYYGKAVDTDENRFYSVFSLERSQELFKKIWKNFDKKKQHSIPYQERLVIALKAAYDIHFTHSMGIIHNDLKPQNLMSDTRKSKTR